MTEAKRFTENIARIAKKMAGECADCSGYGTLIREGESNKVVCEKKCMARTTHLCPGMAYCVDQRVYNKPLIPCPTCHGKEMELVVEEHRVNVYHSGRHCICGIRISAFTSGPHPCDDKPRYRPLTAQEVEDASLDWLIEMKTYKGQPVTLRPKGE